MKLKHYLLLLSVSLVAMAVTPIWAIGLDTGDDDLGGMENAFFHRVYILEDVPERLGRLESIVFGEPQVGDFTQRMNKLLEVASANKLNIEPIPLEEIEGALTPVGPSLDEIAAMDPDASDYPTVSEVEMKVLRQSFTQDPIAIRLKRLEDVVYKRSYEDMPLSSRVDQLVAKFLPHSGLVVEQTAQGLNIKPFPKLPPMQIGPSSQPQQNLDPVHTALATHLNAVELQVFGRNYFGENLTLRVNRLETSLFGSTQIGNFETRFDRILANYQSALQAKAQGQNFRPLDPVQQYPQPQQQFIPPQNFSGEGVGVFNIPTTDDSSVGVVELNPQMPYVPPQNAPHLSQPYVPGQPVQQPYGVQSGQGWQQPNVMQQQPSSSPMEQWPNQLGLMETAVFGRAFNGLQVQDRVTNLEVKLFGYGNNLQPLANRIQQLHNRLSQR